MTTRFVLNGQEYEVKEVVSNTVFASKVKDGKTGRGRPSKFNLEAVQPLFTDGAGTVTLPVSNDEPVVNEDSVAMAAPETNEDGFIILD